jgi:hypothetical protein
MSGFVRLLFWCSLRVRLLYFAAVPLRSLLGRAAGFCEWIHSSGTDLRVHGGCYGFAGCVGRGWVLFCWRLLARRTCAYPSTSGNDVVMGLRYLVPGRRPPDRSGVAM